MSDSYWEIGSEEEGLLPRSKATRVPKKLRQVTSKSDKMISSKSKQKKPDTQKSFKAANYRPRSANRYSAAPPNPKQLLKRSPVQNTSAPKSEKYPDKKKRYKKAEWGTEDVLPHSNRHGNRATTSRLVEEDHTLYAKDDRRRKRKISESIDDESDYPSEEEYDGYGEDLGEEYGYDTKSTSAKFRIFVYVALAVIAVVLLALVICAIASFSVFGSTSSKLMKEIDSLKVSLEGSNGATGGAVSDLRHLVQSQNEQYTALQKMVTSQRRSLERGGIFSPAVSCNALTESTPKPPSGYFSLASPDGGPVVKAYCDMERQCGGTVGGWRRVISLDIADRDSVCPGELILSEYGKVRSCVGNNDITVPMDCTSAFFPVNSIPYSAVCGRVFAYQNRTTNAFRRIHPTSVAAYFPGVENNYVDGVSITYGVPRRHIWTFAATLDEAGTDSDSSCPCNNDQTPNVQQDAIGEDYFCDSGVALYDDSYQRLYTEDLLWDGVNCGSRSRCCSFHSPPWFYKELSQPTKEDIEMRVCRDEINENVAIKEIEFYVR